MFNYSYIYIFINLIYFISALFQNYFQKIIKNVLIVLS